MTTNTPMTDGHREAQLQRRISWPLLALYGLGSTIGAGIYVILGAVAGQAGYYTPVVFVVTSAVAALSALSFAELALRYPVSSGEAAYVRAAFKSNGAALLVGLGVAAAGIISSATLLQGGAGYLQGLINVPSWAMFIVLLIVLVGVAVWGIAESLTTAAVFTLIEIAGLVLVIAIAPSDPVRMGIQVYNLAPSFDLAVVGVIGSSVLLVFYAYIGFEDMVNVVEEVRHPQRDIPVAFAVTFGVSTILYVWISLIAVTQVPHAELGQSSAPLAMIYERLSGANDNLLTYIALAAVLNGVVIQVVMASRVLYGLARQGSIHAVMGRVSSATHTPVIATLCVGVIVGVLGLLFSVTSLAKMTSGVTLSVFVLVNLSLILVKIRDKTQSAPGFRVPLMVPILGCLTSGIFLVGEVLRGLTSVVH